MESASLLLRPTGALDGEACADLRQRLALAFAEGVTSIAVDLSCVTRIDISGLGVLGGAARHLRKRGGVLVVTHASAEIQRAMRVNGLSELLEIPASPSLRVVEGAGETTDRPAGRRLSMVRTGA